MSSNGTTFEDGLSDREIECIENQWSFRFPPDLRQLLQYALPTSERFPNWRSESAKSLERRINWPYRGMCFDIKNNAFWLDTWQERPDSIDSANQIAKTAISQAPFLIPIYSHRYIPDAPSEIGNPVFSVYQTDIIFYGFDLSHYLEREFGVANPNTIPDEPRKIAFWEEIVG
ncbi:SMI1/KNR4 family protein [filamentous cyanobacterium LEGE 07170]|nr:SMI1/KNR4 family protein [filamentous cyanobacterium LEGE 07170]